MGRCFFLKQKRRFFVSVCLDRGKIGENPSQKFS